MNQRKLRHQKVRAKITGTAIRPRLAVFRSLKHIYGQIIDDTTGKTLVVANDLMLQERKGGKITIARQSGELLAEKAATKKINQAVFDRGGFRYAGRVKAFAEGCRKKLKF